MTPSQWKIRWKLLGKPNVLPLDMLVWVPEEVLVDGYENQRGELSSAFNFGTTVGSRDQLFVVYDPEDVWAQHLRKSGIHSRERGVFRAEHYRRTKSGSFRKPRQFAGDDLATVLERFRSYLRGHGLLPDVEV